MSADRRLGRNVHFFNASKPDEPLGGLILNRNTAVMRSTFLQMLGILIVSDYAYTVTMRGSSEALRYDDRRPLEEGNYDITATEGSIRMTDEPILTRTLSHSSTGRDNSFRAQLRNRDGGCVIHGQPNVRAGINYWANYHGAHVFPLAYATAFVREGYNRCITDRASPSDSGINSVQNGLLLRADVHPDFDQYMISVNPDDDFRIYSFALDALQVEGNQLDPACRRAGDESAVRPELLRWHFRQAILANMRGAGEPLFETDFPPGTDMMGEIISSPHADKRMEYELFSRLAVTSTGEATEGR